MQTFAVCWAIFCATISWYAAERNLTSNKTWAMVAWIASLSPALYVLFSVR